MMYYGGYGRTIFAEPDGGTAGPQLQMTKLEQFDVHGAQETPNF
jgi:hypothetical protein